MDAIAFQTATGATGAQLADFEAYRVLLADWNARMNLVGPSGLTAFWERHVYDSWQLSAVEPQALRWADLGSGAGLPGVVLAILLKGRPGAHVHLIESLAKRCRFLSEVVERLSLPAEVHHARAEAFSRPVDIVTARACAPLTRLFGFALPWMRCGATGWFLKGAGAEAEVDAARASWRFEATLVPSRSHPDGRLVRVTRLTAA